MSQAVLARPEKPKIRLTKLFIDNAWVDPAEGGSFETLNPATGEPNRSCRRGNRRRRRSGSQGGPPGSESGPWAKADAADRGLVLLQAGRPG